MSDRIQQLPDTQPGNYYVTIQDGGRTGILAGPFPNDHATALGMVDRASRLACQFSPQAHFAAFGTARFPEDFTSPGVLNDHLDLPSTRAQEARNG